jgi:YfiR/HmsC-like
MNLAIRTLLLLNILAISMLFGTATANEDQRLFKAAFIYNFAKFTRWPATSEDNNKTEINLCTLGEDQLVEDLTRLKGKIINKKTLSVKSFKGPNECDMLYIASSKKNNYKYTLKSIIGKPILTISEIKNFALSGGIIELSHDKGQTRISANLNAAYLNKLELSSRLLILANIVDEKPSK